MNNPFRLAGFSYTALLIGFLVVFASCSNIDERQNWELKGDVKSSLEKKYEAKEISGKWEPGELQNSGHNRIVFASNGLYQEIQYFDNNMKLTGKLVPVRENNNIVEEDYYDTNGKLHYSSKIKPKSKDELEFENFNEAGNKINYGTTYKKDGRIVKVVQTVLINGIESSLNSIVNEYNNDGNIISQKILDEKDKVDSYARFEYTAFDDKGNWTKRLMYKDNMDKPEIITIREIDYY